MISTRPLASELIDHQADVASSDRSRSFIRWSGLAAVGGGALWVLWAALEATHDHDQPAALVIAALLLIAAGMVGFHRLLAGVGKRGGSTVLVVGLLGTALLALRYAFDLWQLFVGLLGVLVACVLLGIAAYRTGTVWKPAALLLIGGAALVVAGNSEGSGPWLWVPFGVGWMAAGLGLWFASATRTLPVPEVQKVAVPFEPAALEAEGASFRPVLTLARVEGRRLITHPIFLASPFVGIVMVGGTALPAGVSIAILLLTAFAFFTIGEGTLLAANLAATRSHRHHTEELYATLPVSARSRTVAGLVALGWAAALGLAINLAAASYLTAHGPLPATGDFGRMPEPFSFLMLQGPAILLLFGAIGIFLARWIPTATVGPIAVVGMFMVEIP
ncbi:MAG TPA: hypothetical protein VF972_09685, partial [Actinomycetota bacterium]